MNLNLVLATDALFNEELENVASVVSLQLDNVTPLLVGKSCSVTAPCFFEGF